MLKDRKRVKKIIQNILDETQIQNFKRKRNHANHFKGSIDLSQQD